MSQHPSLTRRLAPRLMALVTALAALAACGTTVPVAGSGQSAGAGLDAHGALAATAAPEAQAGSARAATSSAGVAGQAGVVAPAGSGPSSAVNEEPLAAPGSAAVRAPLKIGFMTTDFSAIAKAYGFSGSADVLQGFKEMVSYLNKNGGLAGHKIDPDWYYLDGASANGTTAYQAACTHFVQDVHVQLVVTDGNFDPTFETCLAQAHLGHIDINKYGLDAAGQRQYPNYLAPVSFGVDRYTTALVEAAVATRTVTSGQRVGVVIEGCPANIRTYDQVWVPLAKRHGLKVESVQTLCNNGTADLGNETAQIQSAVLKFRSDGVTSVSFVSVSEGFIAVLFAQNAQQQGWHPQYLVSSVSMPERGVESQGNGLNFPPGQLPGIRGVGWAPTTDVGSSAPRPTSAQLTQRALCHRMSPSQAGAANAPDPGVELDFIEHYLMECDTILLLRAALASNGADLTTAALRSGLVSALRSFTSASNLSGSLGFRTTRSDGQDAVAPFSYITACKCVRYVGAARPAA